MRRLSLTLLLTSFSAAQSLPPFLIDSVAGSDPLSDGGPAALACLSDVRAIAVDPTGNIYFSDTARHRVLRIATGGSISIVAGNGAPGFDSDGRVATATALNLPYGVAIDPAGNLYIADLGNARLRRVSPDGRIQTIAGGGALPVTAANALATDVALKGPRNVVVDGMGGVFFSDFLDHRILRISQDGRIHVVAGTGTQGATTDSVPGPLGYLSHPAGLAFDSTGLYVADSGNHAIRKIAAGVMTTLRFDNAPGFTNLPTGVAVDGGGNLYVASSGFGQVVRINRTGGVNVIAREAQDLAVDASGNVFLATGGYVRKLSPSGQLTTLAGIGSQFRGEGTAALQALFNVPADVKLDSSGAFYVADTKNHRVRKIAGGVVTTIAGDGESGFGGDQGAALADRLSSPRGVALDRAGNIYVADTGNHRVRRISPDGRIVTVAGTGTAGFSGDVKLARESRLKEPTAVAVDSLGQVHIADTANHRVRRLLASGYLVTLAGGAEKGFAGDGSSSQITLLDTPRGLAFDSAGNLYIADSGNHRIRKIAPNGLVSTIAGNGTAGFSGDGGKATEASLNAPSAVLMDSSGALLIADAGNQRIRMVTPDGNIQTIAGSGTAGFGGDAGPALSAKLNEPAGLALDSTGAVYLADSQNHRIRKLVRGVAVAPPPAIEKPPEIQVVHAATLGDTALAPGMLISVKGSNIGPTSPKSGQAGPGGTLEASLDGVEVRFDGRPAPILYAQQNLINTQVPYRLSGQPLVLVEVVRDGEARGSAILQVTQNSPGIFTSAGGSGQVTAINEDNTLNSPDTPAVRGSLLTFYATGEGLTDPVAVEGRLAGAPYPVPKAAVEVSIGGQPADIVSQGVGVTSPGVLQLTVRVPAQTDSGSQPVTLKVGSAASPQNTTVVIR
jgi:uncharacterized protein (TIGR03437 family)